MRKCVQCEVRRATYGGVWCSEDCKTIDHVWHEMAWEKSYLEENGDLPEGPEYPEAYPNCQCIRCNPKEAEKRRSTKTGSLPVEEARAIPILEIVERLDIGPARKRGSEYVVTCPFHNDSNPSLEINPGKGVWNCFPCVLGGDGIDLWIEHEGVPFHEAVREMTE